MWIKKLQWIKVLLSVLIIVIFLGCDKIEKPNIILLMADDLGWGDVGFNGNKIIKTSNLDQLASNGVVFDRFYAAAPVCSPTRGSCLTGRNPFRYGIYSANVGFLKKEELTISEILHEYGYTTGHFGKWHLGTLSDSLPDGRRGGINNDFFSPPWENGFDVCFSTEQAVPTWNPMENQPFEIQTHYWIGYRKFSTSNLMGDDSRIIMDRVIPFIEEAIHNDKAFFSVVWFHAPHSPVVAGPEYQKMYSGFEKNKQHYYGCISAIDEQVGRLYDELKRLGVYENTIIAFASDNGPAGAGSTTSKNGQIPGGKNQGETGGFRGRKGVLYEGGIRVPGFIVWPEKISKGKRIDFPIVTSDYYPSILELLEIEMPDRPFDGISFWPALNGEVSERKNSIGFQSPTQIALIKQEYKLIIPDREDVNCELYNLVSDKYEKDDIAVENPELVVTMRKELEEWINSCNLSDNGMDYDKQ